MAAAGIEKVFERQFPRMLPSQVTIEFGKPFYTKELEPEFRKFPGAYVENQIKAMLEAELISQGKISDRA